MHNPRKLTYLSYLAIITMAIASNITPASLVSIDGDLRVGLTRLGTLFLIYFFGFSAVVVFSGIMSDILGRKVLVLGLAVIACGLLGLGFSPSFSFMLISSLVLGAGCGITEGTVSALVADLNPERKGFFLNLSQVFFGFGALVGPFVAGSLIASRLSWRVMYVATAALALVCFGALARQDFPKAAGSDELITLDKLRKLGSNRLFLKLALGMAFYVGSEMGVASWVPTYMATGLSAGAVLAGSALSLFWGSMIIGRFGAGFVLRYCSEAALVFYCAVAGFALLFLAVVVQSPWLALEAFFLVGLAYSPIWPTILAYAGGKFGAVTGSAFGGIIAAGAVGGMTYPWLIGVLADHIGLRFALATALLPILGVALIFGSIFLQERAVGARACEQRRHSSARL
ncbi:MAG TPA: MFS transporter [Firmicutes bacterium]|nr:MFS transporter [Bacillota bacterium]